MYGTFYGAVENAAPIHALLDSMLNQYRTGDENERVDFVQDVQLSKGLYLLSSLVEPEEMEAILTSEVEGKVTYTVEEGDAPDPDFAENGYSLFPAQSAQSGN